MILSDVTWVNLALTLPLEIDSVGSYQDCSALPVKYALMETRSKSLGGMIQSFSLIMSWVAADPGHLRYTPFQCESGPNIRVLTFQVIRPALWCRESSTKYYILQLVFVPLVPFDVAQIAQVPGWALTIDLLARIEIALLFLWTSRCSWFPENIQ